MEPVPAGPEAPPSSPPASANGLAAPDAALRPSEDPTIWTLLVPLYRRRRLIVGVTGVMAVLAVVLALLTPKWYAAEARVLPPEDGGLSVMGLVRSAAGGLGGLLGGGGGEYSRYLTILTSRSMMEDVVDRFDLVEVYELEEREHPRYYTTQMLRENVEFEISMDYNFIAVRAYDRDPERAAAMANFMVERLNERNTALSAQNARQTRLLIEARLDRAQTDLDSVRAELQAFQEEHGVVELESQTQAFMQSLGTLKAEAARLEVQYQTLAQQYGPDNPNVQAAREARRAAQAEVNRVLGGRDAMLPVALRNLPALGRRYAELLQEQIIQQQVIETVYPLYEQTIFQEQNDTEAVQVIDEAVPPVLAARPSRRFMVVAITLTAFVLACLFVLAQALLRQHGPHALQRLHHAARATG